MQPGRCEHWLHAMEKSGIPTFEYYKDPATLGPRWTKVADFVWTLCRWKRSYNGRCRHVSRQRCRSLLLHHAGPDVQDVFSTLPNTGNADNYNAAVTAWVTVNAAYARQSFYTFPKTLVRIFRSLQRVLDSQRRIVHSRATWIIKFGMPL